MKSSNLIDRSISAVLILMLSTSPRSPIQMGFVPSTLSESRTLCAAALSVKLFNSILNLLRAF